MANRPAVDLTSASWGPGERKEYLRQQSTVRSAAGRARGHRGAVTVAHGAYAARAGLEALRQGRNAIDAAMTTTLAQVALTAGAPVSYFGIMSLVYFEASSAKVHSMNAEWNTVLAESDPGSIPGATDFGSSEGLRGRGPASGRTAPVGGFMKGVEAAHERFGKLDFAALFQPSIELAETGIPVEARLDEAYRMRARDLARLPQTRAALLKPDGSPYTRGETLRQPELADTLRRIAAEGASYMYGGPWGQRLVAAVQADGGKMTLEDLNKYQVQWADALIGEIGRGFSIATSPLPNTDGLAVIEAQRLADVAGLTTGPHWTQLPDSLQTALEISQLLMLQFLPPETPAALFPGIDFSPQSRVSRDHAARLWEHIKAGTPTTRWKRTPMHSDAVVVIDADGNMAAITHSINCVLWGKTAINIDGISIGDPAAQQQAQLQRIEPGGRLPAPPRPAF